MVDLPGQVVVAVLTRAPSAGGKSRLFAALDRPPDPRLLSALLLDTLDGVRLPGVTRVVVVEPGDACGDVQRLVPDDVRVIAQSTGTLGERMRAAMAGLLAEGAASVVLVGSDLPDITPDRIAAAAALASGDPASVVLGPAEDGGYYLIAASRLPDVFDGIAWGTPRVLEQTRARAGRRGLRVHLVEPMQDVDTADALRSVVARRTRSWVAATAPWTG
jgi:rSAM/selenodomain-associated transferase 1